MSEYLPVALGEVADPACGWSIFPTRWCVTQSALEHVADTVTSATAPSADTFLSMAPAIRAQQALAAAGQTVSTLADIDPGIMASASTNATGVWGRAAYWAAVGARMTTGFTRAGFLALSETLLQRMGGVASWDSTIGAIPVVNYVTGARETNAYPMVVATIRALRSAGLDDVADTLDGVTRSVFYWWAVGKTAQAVALAGVGALAYAWFVGIPPSDLLQLVRRSQ